MERNGLITVRLLEPPGQQALLELQVQQEPRALLALLRQSRGQLVLRVQRERHRQLQVRQERRAQPDQRGLLVVVLPIKAPWRMPQRCRDTRPAMAERWVMRISRSITRICGFGMARLG